MIYSESSFAGPTLFGPANLSPTHFAHIADWQEKGPNGRLARIDANCKAIYRNHKRSRY